MAEVSKKRVNIGMFLLAILVFVFGGVAGYSYYKYSLAQRELSKLQDPSYLPTLQEQQVKLTIDKLKRIMLLPDDNPTVATLVDVESLKKENEAFYKNAQKGDKLIVYPQQAILFRESENRIINVAPVFKDPNKKDDTEDSESSDTKESTDASDESDSDTASSASGTGDSSDSDNSDL